MHPEWEERTLAHDVAVLTLAADAPDFYAPRQAEADGGGGGGGGIDLTPPVVVNHDPAIPVTGSGVRVAGYGLVSHVWSTPDAAERSVDVRVVAAAPCAASFARTETVEESEPLSSLVHASMHVCAGVAAGGCDACHGDSGGPLYQSMRMPRLRRGGSAPADGGSPQGENDTVRTYVLVGLTSFSPGCADRDTPTAYTRLSAYAGWIDSVVGAGTGPVRPDGSRVGDPDDTATYSFAPPLDDAGAGGGGVGGSGDGGRPSGGGSGDGGSAPPGGGGGSGQDPRGEGGGDGAAGASSAGGDGGGRRPLSAGAAVGIGLGVLGAVVLAVAAVLGGLHLSRSRRAGGAGGGEGGG
ncbi:hypothetical protein I4F81_012067 [Pyropia yezoensis]|uniref:Uncharacterized protein n=1 Tax=Pyropia yezoensis TaxID=2788 RepID=A0ACC3CHE5_PYRYE|nr:hypothetical protein I4F81_012067 [Neopyropia yezoensis]